MALKTFTDDVHIDLDSNSVSFLGKRKRCCQDEDDHLENIATPAEPTGPTPAVTPTQAMIDSVSSLPPPHKRSRYVDYITGALVGSIVTVATLASLGWEEL